MNGRPKQFYGELARRLIGVPCLGAAVGALLTGCVGDPVKSARLNPSSPIAADAVRIVQANRRWPKFGDIPPAPTDVRPAKAFGAAAAETRQAAARLEQETAPGTWSLTATERTDAGLGRLSDEEEIRSRDSEGFVRSGRERATPPPPPR
jgi:hypothetical protein